MSTFADKLKSKVSKFKKQEETKGGTYERDPKLTPSFKVGDVVNIRLLPPKAVLEGNSVDFYREMFFHSYPKAKNTQQYDYFVCPKNKGWEGDGTECPFCDFASETYESMGSTQDYKNYKRKKTFVFVGVVTSYSSKSASDEHKKDWESCIGVAKIFHFNLTLKKKIISDMDEIGEAIFNPEEGYDFIVKCESKSTVLDNGQTVTFNNYDTSGFARKLNAIGKQEVIDEVIEEVENVDDYILGRVISNGNLKTKAVAEAILDKSEANIDEQEDRSAENASQDKTEETKPTEEASTDTPNTEESTSEEGTGDKDALMADLEAMFEK